MLNKYLTFVFSICFLYDLGLSQSNNSEFLKWGAGIVKDTSGYKAGVINFPKQEIILYNEEGKAVGIIFPDSITSKEPDSFWWLRARLNSDTTLYSVTREDFIEVTYEGVCLKYYERKQQFIRVLQNIFSNAPIYLKISDIENLGYEILDWREFIGSSKRSWWRFDHLSSALVLRKAPSIISEAVLSFGGTLFVIKIIGPWKGSWVYIEIAHYSKYDMVPSESDLLHRYRGWIKALDDKGFPNIWFFTRD